MPAWAKLRQGLFALQLKKEKEKSESYIFYKLSAVKEGAKIKTINTVHNYFYLLPQPIASPSKSLL